MPNKDLFHSTSLRLTAVYLVIIMSISMLFSIGLYRVSLDELERNIRRPESGIERLIRSQRSEEFRELQQQLEIEQDEELREARNRLLSNLLMINVFILVFGGAVSYMLARRTLKPIEEAHEAQSRFTADASHELRTPITAMRAETELTLTEPKLTLKAAKKQLESNIEELDKLTSLSEGLLQLARLENSDLQKETIELDHVLQQAIDRILKKAEQKKQTLRVTGKDNITLRANQMAVVEALVTLLDNAVKYSPEKSEITITKRSQSSTVSVSIKDVGVGIKASELPHVFDRFYRADSSRTKSAEHGYGIGLSIAKSVAESHGGTISVKSTLDKGSTFTLSLPK